MIEADGLMPAQDPRPDAAPKPQAGEVVSPLSATGYQKPDRE
jgi:hypothetical protein